MNPRIAVALLLPFLLAGSGCAANGAAESAATTPAPPPADCAALWSAIRKEAVAAGVPDGEARREADLARVECEDLANPPVSEPPETVSPCPDREGQLAEDEVRIYFACGDDLSVAAVLRSIKGGDISERVRQAVASYLAGPSDAEQSEGLISPMPTDVLQLLESVKLSDGTVQITFTDEYAPGPFGSTAAALFEDQLAATLFQFDAIDRISLDVNGDCERFWRPLQMRCHQLEKGR